MLGGLCIAPASVVQDSDLAVEIGGRGWLVGMEYRKIILYKGSSLFDCPTLLFLVRNYMNSRYIDWEIQVWIYIQQFFSGNVTITHK
jgi:hypothetical protein